jgi:hypothetical protein
MQAGLTTRRLTFRGDFLLDVAFLVAAKCFVRVPRLGAVGQRGPYAPFSGGLATLDDGSTLQAQSLIIRRRALPYT